jgi:hypothetical protein
MKFTFLYFIINLFVGVRCELVTPTAELLTVLQSSIRDSTSLKTFVRAMNMSEFDFTKKVFHAMAFEASSAFSILPDGTFVAVVEGMHRIQAARKALFTASTSQDSVLFASIEIKVATGEWLDASKLKVLSKDIAKTKLSSVFFSVGNQLENLYGLSYSTAIIKCVSDIRKAMTGSEAYAERISVVLSSFKTIIIKCLDSLKLDCPLILYNLLVYISGHSKFKTYQFSSRQEEQAAEQNLKHVLKQIQDYFSSKTKVGFFPPNRSDSGLKKMTEEMAGVIQLMFFLFVCNTGFGVFTANISFGDTPFKLCCCIEAISSAMVASKRNGKQVDSIHGLDVEMRVASLVIQGCETLREKRYNECSIVVALCKYKDYLLKTFRKKFVSVDDFVQVFKWVDYVLIGCPDAVVDDERASSEQFHVASIKIVPPKNHLVVSSLSEQGKQNKRLVSALLYQFEKIKDQEVSNEVVDETILAVKKHLRWDRKQSVAAPSTAADASPAAGTASAGTDNAVPASGAAASATVPGDEESKDSGADGSDVGDGGDN